MFVHQMDQHLVKPLSAFISVFCSLLKTVFSDPRESTLQWRRRILDSLAVNGNIFLALLPKEWRIILLDGQESEEMDSDMTSRIDWESWVKQFRTWSYGLLRLFASEERPLVSSPSLSVSFGDPYRVSPRLSSSMTFSGWSQAKGNCKYDHSRSVDDPLMLL